MRAFMLFAANGGFKDFDILGCPYAKSLLILPPHCHKTTEVSFSASRNARPHPSRSNFLRASLPARRISSAFWRANFLGRLLEMLLELHFTENAFTLELFLPNPEGLVDIVVANINLHVDSVLP